MKTIIKQIGNVSGEGVTLILTEKAVLGKGMATKEWIVSWDGIGRALFGEQYSDSVSVKDLKADRGEN